MCPGEAGGEAVVNIVFRAVTAERDPWDRVAAVEIAHQIVTAPIGQAEIADENVEAAGQLSVALEAAHSCASRTLPAQRTS